MTMLSQKSGGPKCCRFKQPRRQQMRDGNGKEIKTWREGRADTASNDLFVVVSFLFCASLLIDLTAFFFPLPTLFFRLPPFCLLTPPTGTRLNRYVRVTAIRPEMRSFYVGKHSYSRASPPRKKRDLFSMGLFIYLFFFFALLFGKD